MATSRGNRHCVIVVSAEFRSLSTARTVGESVEDVVQRHDRGAGAAAALLDAGGTAAACGGARRRRTRRPRRRCRRHLGLLLVDRRPPTHCQRRQLTRSLTETKRLNSYIRMLFFLHFSQAAYKPLHTFILACLSFHSFPQTLQH